MVLAVGEGMPGSLDSNGSGEGGEKWWDSGLFRWHKVNRICYWGECGTQEKERIQEGY